MNFLILQGVLHKLATSQGFGHKQRDVYTLRQEVVQENGRAPARLARLGGVQGTRELRDGSAPAGTDDRTGRYAEATGHVDDETRLWPRARLRAARRRTGRSYCLIRRHSAALSASLTDTRTRATGAGRAASPRSGGLRCGGPPGPALGKHSSSGAWPTSRASLSRRSSFSGQQKWLFSS